MSLGKKQRYVIFDGPQQHKAPGTRYIAGDGSSTDIRAKAARFYSHLEARDFANEKGVVLTDFVHIGIEDFTDFELSR